MKLDPQHKAQKLGAHVPGFRGYAPPHAMQTDLLLRRHLVGELGKVRDRLADLIAAHGEGGELHEPLAECLRRLATLKDEIAPVAGPEEKPVGAGPTDEERLIEFDLLLLDKLAALHTPLDEMEWSRQEALAQALRSLEEGINQLTVLYRRRREVLFPPERAPISR